MDESDLADERICGQVRLTAATKANEQTGSRRRYGCRCGCRGLAWQTFKCALKEARFLPAHKYLR